MLLINILLVDDHVLFSKSLEIALSDYPEIKAFKSINDISLLDKFIEEDAPDILLMDINLKNISSKGGLELAKQILSNYPEQKIVILSGYDLPVYRNEAKKNRGKRIYQQKYRTGKANSFSFADNAGKIYLQRLNSIFRRIN